MGPELVAEIERGSRSGTGEKCGEESGNGSQKVGT
jgi:hypothetical protein